MFRPLKRVHQQVTVSSELERVIKVQILTTAELGYCEPFDLEASQSHCWSLERGSERQNNAETLGSGLTPDFIFEPLNFDFQFFALHNLLLQHRLLLDSTIVLALQIQQGGDGNSESSATASDKYPVDPPLIPLELVISHLQVSKSYQCLVPL